MPIQASSSDPSPAPWFAARREPLAANRATRAHDVQLYAHAILLQERREGWQVGASVRHEQSRRCVRGRRSCARTDGPSMQDHASRDSRIMDRRATADCCRRELPEVAGFSRLAEMRQVLCLGEAGWWAGVAGSLVQPARSPAPPPSRRLNPRNAFSLTLQCGGVGEHQAAGQPRRLPPRARGPPVCVPNQLTSQKPGADSSCPCDSWEPSV